MVVSQILGLGALKAADYLDEATTGKGDVEAWIDAGADMNNKPYSLRLYEAAVQDKYDEMGANISLADVGVLGDTDNALIANYNHNNSINQYNINTDLWYSHRRSSANIRTEERGDGQIVARDVASKRALQSLEYDYDGIRKWLEMQNSDNILNYENMIKDATNLNLNQDQIDEIQRRIDFITENDSNKRNYSLVHSSVKNLGDMPARYFDFMFGSRFKGYGNISNLGQEVIGLGTLGASKVANVKENIADYFNPLRVQERERTPDVVTESGFEYDPEHDGEWLDALAMEWFTSAAEGRQNIDNKITYHSALYGNRTLQSGLDMLQEGAGLGRLFQGRAILKGQVISSANREGASFFGKKITNVDDLKNVYDVDKAKELSRLSDLSFKQRYRELRNSGAGVFKSLFKTLPIVGQATRHNHLFELAGAYGDDAAYYANRMYAYSNIGASLSGTSLYLAQLSNPENTFLNNGFATVSIGVIGGFSAPFIGDLVVGAVPKIYASMSLGLTSANNKNYRARLNRLLTTNQDIPPGLVDEIDEAIDALPESMVPQGRFNADGEVNRDGYLYDQFILGSPRLRNIDPDSPEEAAYVQAQMAFNRKMDFVRLNKKELKNNSNFMKIFHSLKDSKNRKMRQRYDELMTEIEATHVDIDKLKSEFIDEKGVIRERYKGKISAEDVQDLEVYFDMYMGTTMLSQFTDVIREGADLGILGTRLEGLFVNDYLDMLGAMESNLIKLSNMHKAVVDTFGFDDMGNANPNVMRLFKEMDDSRVLQEKKFKEKFDYIDAEAEKLRIYTKQELLEFTPDDLYGAENLQGRITARDVPGLEEYDKAYSSITGSSRGTRDQDIIDLGEQINKTLKLEYKKVFGDKAAGIKGRANLLYDKVKFVEMRDGTQQARKIFFLDTEQMGTVASAAKQGDGFLVQNTHWQGLNTLFEKGGAPIKRTYTPEPTVENPNPTPVNIYVDDTSTLDDLIRVRSEFNSVRQENLGNIRGHDAGENQLAITKYLDDNTDQALKEANAEYQDAAETWKGGLGARVMETDVKGSGANIATPFKIHDILIEGILNDPNQVGTRLIDLFGDKNLGMEYLTKSIAHRIHMGRPFTEDEFSKIRMFYNLQSKLETSGGELIQEVPTQRTPILGRDAASGFNYNENLKKLNSLYGARNRIQDQVDSAVNSFKRGRINEVNQALIDEGNLNIMFKGLGIEPGKRSMDNFYNQLNSSSPEGIEELKTSFFNNYSGPLTEQDFDNAILYVAKTQLVRQFRDASNTARVPPKPVRRRGRIDREGTEEEKRGWVAQLTIEADGYQQVLNNNENILNYIYTKMPTTKTDVDTLEGIQLLERGPLTPNSKIKTRGKIRNIPTPTEFSTYQSYLWAYMRGIVGAKWILAQAGRTHLANMNAKMFVQVLTNDDAASMMYKISNGQSLNYREKLRFKDFFISIMPSLSDVYGDMTEGERLGRQGAWDKKFDKLMELVAEGNLPTFFDKMDATSFELKEDEIKSLEKQAKELNLQ